MATDLKSPDKAVGLAVPSLSSLPAVFASVFEEMGGQARLREWAEENYGDYLKLMVRMIPAQASAPPPGAAGNWVKVSPLLKRTILDGEKEEPADG